MHSDNGVYDKDALGPMYESDAFPRGFTRGLNRFYNTLMRIFRNSIAPQAGNLDAIRGGLVNLLVYAQWIDDADKLGEDVSDIRPIDVMDFIFREMKHCIMGRHVPVYAPYVMLLLMDAANVSPTEDCVVHKFSYIQDKLTSVELNAGVSAHPAGSSRRTRSASAAAGAESSRSAASRSYFPDTKDKKPNPWERLLMCMCMDMRKSVCSTMIHLK